MNRIAVSLALPDTEMTLDALVALSSKIGMAEIRLDMMTSFNLAYLKSHAPCPLIITCRPLREGGSFRGTESERLGILMEAIALGFAYIDVEWDSINSLNRHQGDGSTQFIVSRHWYDKMPTSLWSIYEHLRSQADIVKVVGLAHDLADMLPIFDLFSRATSPLIAIAMGQHGQLTRLLAPCFSPCLLTYATHTSAVVTASGQMTVDDLVNHYHLQDVGPHTTIYLHLCADVTSFDTIIACNSRFISGQALYVPLTGSPDELFLLGSHLRGILPNVKISADPILSETVRDIL